MDRIRNFKLIAPGILPYSTPPRAGWFLSKSDGPQLHYGAHDYFPTARSGPGQSGQRQEEVRLPSSGAAAPNWDSNTLFTMIVDKVWAAMGPGPLRAPPAAWSDRPAAAPQTRSHALSGSFNLTGEAGCSKSPQLW